MDTQWREGLPTSDVGRQLDCAGAAYGYHAVGMSLEVGSRMFRIGEAALLPLLHWRVIVKRQECRFPEYGELRLTGPAFAKASAFAKATVDKSAGRPPGL